jgi:hypothetical protein
MAKVYGFPAYQFATMPHPLANLDQQQIDACARELMPQVLRILSGAGILGAGILGVES